MPEKFLELAATESVQAAQEHYYGAAPKIQRGAAKDTLSQDEVEFIRSRDSFYLATISENGWPYIQHRGGKPGFLSVLDARTLGFADFRGNRQMLSTGNIAANNRVSLFLMDYPHRARLKILGHARVEDAEQNPNLLRQLADPAAQHLTERLFIVDVVAFDWNCPKYITPRYSLEEIRDRINPLQMRIAELEAKLKNRA